MGVRDLRRPLCVVDVAVSNLKRVVRARMTITRESYVTALMRVRECKLPPLSSLVPEMLAKKSIEQSPPRKGA